MIAFASGLSSAKHGPVLGPQLELRTDAPQGSARLRKVLRTDSVLCKAIRLAPTQKEAAERWVYYDYTVNEGNLSHEMALELVCGASWHLLGVPTSQGFGTWVSPGSLSGP